MRDELNSMPESRGVVIAEGKQASAAAAREGRGKGRGKGRVKTANKSKIESVCFPYLIALLRSIILEAAMFGNSINQQTFPY